MTAPLLAAGLGLLVLALSACSAEHVCGGSDVAVRLLQPDGSLGGYACLGEESTLPPGVLTYPGRTPDRLDDPPAADAALAREVVTARARLGSRATDVSVADAVRAAR
ncbi:MAG: hypothetical protein JWM64_868 [Frankiales bacterium]|nr:hypothetical protein [Frankiales bacterium]